MARRHGPTLQIWKTHEKKFANRNHVLLCPLFEWQRQRRARVLAADCIRKKVFAHVQSLINGNRTKKNPAARNARQYFRQSNHKVLDGVIRLARWLYRQATRTNCVSLSKKRQFSSSIGIRIYTRTQAAPIWVRIHTHPAICGNLNLPT